MEVQGWYRSLLEAQPVRFMETTAMQGEARSVEALQIRCHAFHTMRPLGAPGLVRTSAEVLCLPASNHCRPADGL